MSILAKACALLEAATQAELDAMPPNERRRAAELLAHWAHLAGKRARTMQPSQPPKSGVLMDLHDGQRAP